jgi:adenylylsulfate kinase
LRRENIIPHKSGITGKDREKMKGHRAVCLWFTGLSGSGKSTLAHRVEEELFARGFHTYVLDGDNVRMGLNSNLSFSPEDRAENIRRIGEVSRLFVEAGVIVITAFISPFKKDREQVRKMHKEGQFVEIFVDCPLAVCEQRDVKGLYKKARQGEINDFTGIGSPYEITENPEITVNTVDLSLEEAAARVIRYLENNIKRKK